MKPKKLAAALAVLALASITHADHHHLELVHKDDFEKEAKAWLPTEPAKWSVEKLDDGNRAYKLHGKSDYQPPHRSPHSISLLKDKVLGDFVLTARVQTLQTTRGHRDMCVFFGFQDPTHFYYVHLGEVPDPHSSQIFIVNDAPRTKITETKDIGVPWKDKTWHRVKVVRKVKSGLIEIYFDDMEKPQKVAHDKTFQWGAIGLGSFDDLGLWDDIEIRGEIVDHKADQDFKKADAIGRANAEATKKAKQKKQAGGGSVKNPSAKVGGDSQIVAISASENQNGNPPLHVLDESGKTKWAAEGKGQWIQMELNKTTPLDRLIVGFVSGHRDYAFEIKGSTDGRKFTSLGKFQSEKKGEAPREYKFKKTPARFIRVVVNGNNENDWANIHTLALNNVGRAKKVAASVEKASKPSGFNPAGKAESLKFTKWSGAVNVPDPVAISLDNQGRAYVTQTQRRKANDLDIRQNRDWIPNDLSFTSVAEKKAFYRERMAPDLWQPGMPERVADLNGDDSRDWLDLTALTEKIHLIEDTDGDGKADRIQTYAEEFNTEVTGIAAGVLWHEGDVYSTIAPDVWRLRDTNGDGKADQREVMAHGFGVHIAYAGHDMHGLKVGFDGKIYWSIGDKGISVVTRDGREFLYPNQGGMMRCNPDGTDFEVFAHGLRNVQEPAFDQFGNWFGVDNDSDQSGEKERFVYIVEGMDAGWRCNYQYRGSGYNPWTAEKIWQPYQDGQPAHVIPPISNYIDGPAGFTFNPGTALNDAYRDHFFLTGAPNGNQYAFRAEPRGASFAMVGDHQIGKGVPIVGWNFGPDGGLYGVDWGGGYPLNQSGAVWKIDDPAYADSPARKEVATLLKDGFHDRNAAELTKLLGHADQRARLGAQFELAKRNDIQPLLNGLRSPEQLARVHAVWGLGQLGNLGRSDAAEALLRLLKDKDVEIRAQASRALGDLKQGMFDGKALITGVASGNPRLQLHAAIALHKHGVPEAFDPLVKLADSLKPEQTYLRHAAAYGLAGCADSQRIGNLANHNNPNVRLIAVVALRNQPGGGGEAGRFLTDKNEAVATEAARLAHDDWSDSQGMTALAATLKQPEKLPSKEAFLRRAISSGFRLGGQHNAANIARYAARTNAPKAMRLEALGALADWQEPNPLDRVTGRYRNFDADARTIKVDELAPHITSLLRDKEADIQAKAVEVTIALGIPVASEALLAIVSDTQAARPVRVAALNGLADNKSNLLRKSVDIAVQDSAPDLRIRGLQLLAGMDAKAAVERIFWTFEKVTNAPERQNAARLMGDLDRAEVDSFLATALQDKDIQREWGSIWLELIEAAEKRAAASKPVAAQLKALQARREAASNSNPLAQFEECLDGGDRNRGKEIFNTHIFAQCARCHTVKKGKGSDIGPNLQTIGEKDKRELLHSLIDPAAQIAEGYGNLTVVRKDNSFVSGTLRRESAQEVVVRTPEGKDVTIPVAEIQQRTPIVSLMPPMGQILKKHEIRDVLAYLTTLKGKKK